MQRQVYVERPPGDVFSYFADPRHWERITADPSPDVLVAGGEGVVAQGAVLSLRTARSGRVASMSLFVEECDHDLLVYVERQLAGPFAEWILRRRVVSFQDGALVNEQVEFRFAGAKGLLPERLVPSGPVDTWLVYRQQAAKRILEQLMRVRGVSTVR